MQAKQLRPLSRAICEARIKAMSDVMWKEPVAKGTAIIKQNEMQAMVMFGPHQTNDQTLWLHTQLFDASRRQADYFYIVRTGSFSITKAEDVKEGQSPLVAESRLPRFRTCPSAMLWSC